LNGHAALQQKAAGSEIRMKDTLVLKKYANRRLYDTEQSAYVTLQELAAVIRKGRRVRVLDAQSGEDVSASILTQIVLEEAKNNNALLPVPLLHLIIQFGDNHLVDFFETYLQQIIQAYLAQKTAFEDHFRQWVQTGMRFSGLPAGSMADLGGLKTLFEMNPFLKPAGRAETSEGEDPGEDGR
jgi:polyhydroxyalkanoate synthesis repressor PhaR